ncbi:MAG: PAS domain S-box protein [Balneolales bacterium]
MESPTPKVVLQPDSPRYTIVEVNDAFLEATHSKKEDLTGKSFFEAFPENPNEDGGGNGARNIRVALGKGFDQKKAQKLEVLRYDIPVQNSGKFEKKFWIPHLYPLINDHREIDYVIYAPVDVTKRVLAELEEERAHRNLQREIHSRKRIQQLLIREKNFAESLVKCLPGVFYLFDVEGNLCQWNQNLEELTGYTSDEINEMHPLDFIAKDYVGKVKCVIEKTFENGSGEVDAPLLLKDGRTVPFKFNGMIVKLNDQDFLLGMGSDISEQVQRMHLSEVLERSRNEIYIFDEKTLNFVDVNSGARENLGYSLEELKKMTPLDFKPEFTLSEFIKLIKPLRNGAKDKVVFNTVHQRKDGSFYNVEVHLQLIQQQGYRFFVAIILDITERLRIEEKVKASLQEKEVLLNEIHHRVKNNLAIVSSLLNMQAGTIESDKVKRILTESEGRIRSMGMIHELLYEQEFFSSINFCAYIKKLLKYVALNFDNPDKTITTELKLDDIFFSIDTAVPCALIVNELLTNAYKHAFTGRKEGRISINMVQTDDSYTLVFSDNGIGISGEPKGSMGLSLVYGLGKQIGGTITLDKDGGTRYMITFPKVNNRDLTNQFGLSKMSDGG